MSVEKLKSIISSSSNIVFFGGAGVSTESNIPDFRSEKGIYNTKSKYGYSPEYMLSHTFFIEHTDEFFEYYKNLIKMQSRTKLIWLWQSWSKRES